MPCVKLRIRMGWGVLTVPIQCVKVGLPINPLGPPYIDVDGQQPEWAKNLSALGGLLSASINARGALRETTKTALDSSIAQISKSLPEGLGLVIEGH